MTEDVIEPRRQRIRDIDREIVHLVAERMDLARVIGRAKRAKGLPIRNYAVEAEVIRQIRDACEGHGIRQSLGEDVVKILIEESLRVQEADRRTAARARAGEDGRRALVLGGRGNMGAWFSEFLETKGYAVTVADPRGPLPGYAYVEDWVPRAGDFQLILIATPPSFVEGLLDEVESSGTDALVFEIASLKSPFAKKLEKLAEAGRRVTSVHPMWGPATDLLAEKNVIVCGCGNPEADREARGLFEDTAANIVDLPLAAHDALMAHTLGLPHALNLVFGRALARGPHGLDDLKPLGGPTFTKQLAVAAEVAGENKDLYYEIQRLNVHTPEVYAALERGLRDLQAAVADRQAFRDYMAGVEAWFSKEGEGG